MSNAVSMNQRRARTAARGLRSWAIAAVIGSAAIVVATSQIAERPLINASTHPAIKYTTEPTQDVVAQLSRRVEDGSASLSYDAATGYLKPVLDALHVPA